MNFLHYDDIDFVPYRATADKIVKSALPIVVEKHGVAPETILSSDVENKIARILSVNNGSLEGITLLDLGCGISNFEDAFMVQERLRRFEPWLLRLLAYSGIEGFKGIGIDIGRLKDEPFEFFQTDLYDENSLSMIKSESVNVVNACFLFNSPYLVYSVLGVSLFISQNHEDTAGKALYRVLEPQLDRILRPNGVFIYAQLKVESE